MHDSDPFDVAVAQERVRTLLRAIESHRESLIKVRQETHGTNLARIQGVQGYVDDARAQFADAWVVYLEAKRQQEAAEAARVIEEQLALAKEQALITKEQTQIAKEQVRIAAAQKDAALEQKSISAQQTSIASEQNAISKAQTSVARRGVKVSAQNARISVKLEKITVALFVAAAFQAFGSVHPIVAKVFCHYEPTCSWCHLSDPPRPAPEKKS